MKTRLLLVAMMLAPALASADNKKQGPAQAFLPVGWHPGERWATKPPSTQTETAPKEYWDTPVDGMPDWSKDADWDAKEKATPKHRVIPR